MKDSFGSQNNNYHDDIWHISLFQELVQRLIPRLHGTRLPWKRLGFFPIFGPGVGALRTSSRYNSRSRVPPMGVWVVVPVSSPCPAGQWSMDPLNNLKMYLRCILC